MKPARYIGGTYPGLRNECALVRQGPRGYWLAQFDNLSLSELCLGWHKPPKRDFQLITRRKS